MRLRASISAVAHAGAVLFAMATFIAIASAQNQTISSEEPPVVVQCESNQMASLQMDAGRISCGCYSVDDKGDSSIAAQQQGVLQEVTGKSIPLEDVNKPEYQEILRNREYVTGDKRVIFELPREVERRFSLPERSTVYLPNRYKFAIRPAWVNSAKINRATTVVHP